MRSVLSRLYLRFIVYSLGVHKGVYLLLGLALAFPGVSVRFPPALRIKGSAINSPAGPFSGCISWASVDIWAWASAGIILGSVFDGSACAFLLPSACFPLPFSYHTIRL